jgi:hypothetical protein
MMALPDELEEDFCTDLDRIEEEENKVRYVTSIERMGIEIGERQGERKGLLKGIAISLDSKFGPAQKKLLRKVRALPDVAALVRFMRFLSTADSVEEVREFLDQESR